MQEKIKQIKENKMVCFQKFQERKFKPFGFSKISHIFSASNICKTKSPLPEGYLQIRQYFLKNC
jgi:hypothetical protein